MPKWAFRATSRTGQKVNIITGAPTDEITVHSEDELNERLAVAENDPRDLQVEIRRLTD
ncbi:hypothetical protein [Streptomyces sp. WAC01280]|uniref:hypothetical protein n=1 Tax=Streptomyces sp. WAC01280 TaxID=2487424 RepID=UPI00163B644B|nr:hypothetical protein [Streptomyces sp. WAC01280]